ncbi:MAG: hypothetical protein DSY77_05080 [Bacteroidetes bacterium]|nr:MAG: hypothetical protein DSY77_05080 [Bacteroidota bacterium]
MKNKIHQSLKIQRTIAILILLLGVLLLVYMIVVENEFGALPLLFILSGSIWFYRLKFKIKKYKI